MDSKDFNNDDDQNKLNIQVKKLNKFGNSLIRSNIGHKVDTTFMDVPHISKMWDMLQNNSLISKSSVLSNCEAEVQELMHQIDIMVQSRKSEWENERQTLTAKLDVCKQEYLIQKSTLEQKHHEIGQLRSSIDSMQQTQKDMTTGYQTQLAAFKDEISRMKREYDKLQKRYQKQSKDSQNKIHEDAETQRLTSRLDDYRQRSMEWEHEKRSLQKQLESLQLQNKTLNDKCEFIAQQSSNYQSQADRWREMLENTEMNLKSQISQMEGQLQRRQEALNDQGPHLNRLKMMVDDATQAQRRALQEKEQIESDLRNALQIIRKFENEADETRLNKEMHQELLKCSNEERSNLKDQILRLELQLKDKDNLIKSLQISSNPDVLAPHLQALESELSQARNELKASKRTEMNLTEELARLQQHFSHSRQDGERLTTELSKTVSDARSESTALRQLKAENGRLSDELKSIKGQYKAELDSLRRKEIDLNAEIDFRNDAIKTLKDRIVKLEKQMLEQKEDFEKGKMELQVANAQLNALRQENRHLRRNVEVPNSSSSSLNQNQSNSSKDHILDLQKAYSESLKTLELRNAQLESVVLRHKADMSKVEENARSQIKMLTDENDRLVKKMKDEAKRKSKELSEMNERSSSMVEDRMRELNRQYEDKFEKLETKITSLEDELSSKNRFLAKISRENEAKNSFVHGVDTIVKIPSPNSRSLLTCSRRAPSPSQTSAPADRSSERTSSNGNSSGDNKTSCVPTSNVDEDEDLISDSAGAAAEEFLQLQEQRMHELERLLNSHIDELRMTTDTTLQKFRGAQ